MALNWFKKLKTGLSKSASKVENAFASVTGKKTIDQEVLNDIEDQLILADLGVEVASRIANKIKQQKFELNEKKEITKIDVAETLASEIENDNEEKDSNVVKVIVDDDIKKNSFARALDFFRISNKPLNKLTYHHVGIYAFTSKALIRYVSLDRSKLEINRKLEQLRALEDKMKIDVGYIDTCPLSVDTEADLVAVKKLMER